MRKICLLILAFAFCVPAIAIDKKELEQRYKGKYLVVMHEGISVGFPIAGPTGTPLPGVTSGGPPTQAGGAQGVRIDGDHAELYTLHTPLDGVLPLENRIGSVISEAIHPGEVLRILGVKCCPQDSFEIGAQTVSLPSITRGRGANEHESHEVGLARIQFIIPSKTNYDAVAAVIDKWLKPFDTQDAAANFGNTASGAFVKEVKLGMTPAEVESVMGLPVSKADLGEKMLYKYKDMTVEFHDGKVTDVR